MLYSIISNICQKIVLLDDCIYDLSFIIDPTEMNLWITHLMVEEFNELVLAKLNNQGKILVHKLWIIEEAQNLLGRWINPTSLRAISEGRNYGLCFAFSTQRLADLSTQAVERCNAYLLGK